jgi:hypothetical protein
MMIAVAIAGSLVVYAWIMGYIGVSTERSGEAITIQNVFNDGTDLLIYVQNVGEGVVQLDEDECLYVNGILVPCKISGVTVSDDLATLAQGETATLRYVGGAALPGEKVKIKVTTLHGTPAEKIAYPAGTAHATPGTVIWNRTYGGFWGEGAYALVVTSDGGYAIAGYKSNMSDHDFWLVKVDAYGNEEWNRTYGRSYQDNAYALVVTSDGGYAIAGSTRSFVTGDNDFWLIKTDSSGNMEWNQTYGGFCHSLVATSDGGYAMAGYRSNLGDQDFLLVKTDADGNMEWSQTYGGTGSDGADSLVTTADGGYALAGYTMSFGTVFGDFWLVKTDAAGVMEWSQTYGGPESDLNGSGVERAQSVVVTSDGGYILAGDTEESSSTGVDFLLVKTDESGYMEWSQTYGGTSADHAFSVVESTEGGYAIAGTSHGDFWLIKTN